MKTQMTTSTAIHSIRFFRANPVNDNHKALKEALDMVDAAFDKAGDWWKFWRRA